MSAVNGVIALAVAAAAVWTWSRGFRVLPALLGVVAALWACVAVRNLPDPVIVSGLLVILAGVAAVTAWSLIRTRSRTERTASRERWTR